MELYELRISIMNRKGDALADFASTLLVSILLAVNVAVCAQGICVICWMRESIRYRSARDMCQYLPLK